MYDSKKADVFAEALMEHLNGGALMLMLSIGHRTGLFDVLKGCGFKTSPEIAELSGLNERYVREWLGAMTSGRITEYKPDTGEYRLPDENASFLCRSASPNNMAVFAQYIGLLGGVEDHIVECFRKGGGVNYSEYPRFHEVMAEDSEQTVLSSLLEQILPLCEGLVDRLEEGIQVADLGCGRGKAAILLAKSFPKSQFLAVDLSAEAIAAGRADAMAAGIENLTFREMDLSTYGNDAPEERYDFVTTFDAVHDQPDPASLLKGIYRSLRPGGVYLMQDIHSTGRLEDSANHPVGPLLYTISTMHCTSVSLAQGGEGLGTMWGREKARELLEEAGFKSMKVHQLPHDFQNDYYVLEKLQEDES